MKLTLYERMVLANQYAILENLLPNGMDREALREAREAIERGYELHYDHAAQHFYKPMSEAECTEVVDILQMFRVVTFSIRDLGDKAGIDEDRLTFDGFDGNEESRQHGFAKWFCGLDHGRFTELTQRPGFDFNSHASRLSRYRAMLAAYRGLGEPTELTREQLMTIAPAST